MNVKELKEALENLPDDMEIILQKDSEGNGYSPLSGADDECIYVSHEAWYGNVYATTNSADDNCMGDDEWEELKKKPRCLVLHPMN